MLWFAQNSLPLRWQRQHQTFANANTKCCDLLKIHYLCGDKDNSWNRSRTRPMVVICSKFITFAVTKTTATCHGTLSVALWFAQNSLPLRWQRQQTRKYPYIIKCCDLLKIHYLCGDKDNRTMADDALQTVVICSKFITFAVTKTTRTTDDTKDTKLWFAQNSLDRRWQRQQTRK